MMRPMRRRLSVLALAIAAIGTAPAAFAQTASPPADQDHRAHHPDAAAPAKPGAPATPPMQQGDKSMGMMGQGGMMCGDMKRDMKSMMGMMHDMMGMMSMHSGMMPPAGRQHPRQPQADLKINEAQALLWDRFAEVWRSASTVLKGQHKEMMASGDLNCCATGPAFPRSAANGLAEERRGGAGAAGCLLQRRAEAHRRQGHRLPHGHDVRRGLKGPSLRSG